MTTRNPVLLLAPALLADCGPTPVEAGRAVLSASPLVVLGIGLALWLLLAFWRRRYPELVFPKRLFAELLAGLMALAAVLVLAVPLVSPWRTRWIMAALHLYGTSHLVVAALVFRIWFWRHRETAIAGALIVSSVLMLLPAVPMAAGWRSPALARLAFDIWIFAGWRGWIAFPLLMALFVEAALRGGPRPGDLDRGPDSG